MRKLASIQKIENLIPIEGADRIIIATVLGWSMVTQKSNNFQIGDKVVHFETDSFLPIYEKLEFLRPGSYRVMADGSEGFRIRTIRLRGQISQGLILPIKEFPELVNLEVGTDLTDILKVKKWEPPVPACLDGVVISGFPGFLFKTDETRIQSYPKVLERHKGKKFYYTEKLDGSSCTIFNNEGDFGVCGREWRLAETEENTLWKVTNKYNLKEKLPRDISIQGEIIGEGIQGNKYKMKGQDIRIFNAFDIKKGCFVDTVEFIYICNALGITPVPCLGEFVLDHTIEELVKLATRESDLIEDWAEGIVVRPFKEEIDPELGRLSFKVINPEFLLKWGD